MMGYSFSKLVSAAASSWENSIMILEKIPPRVLPTTASICVTIGDNTLRIRALEHTVDKDGVLNALNSHPPKRKKAPKKKRGTKVEYSCPDCGKKFLVMKVLAIHLMNSARRDVCVVCGKVCDRGDDILRHLADAHDEKWQACASCPTIKRTSQELSEHIKLAHSEGAISCAECGRTFTHTSTLEAHSQLHSARTCRKCGAQFSTRGCYRVHRSKCEPNNEVAKLPRGRRHKTRDRAQFSCDYCKKHYKSRTQLKNHITWIHMGIRSFKCKECGKSFYTSSRLLDHAVVHTRERNFGCDICGARLVSRMAAIYHRRRHTGEKPYECEYCGDKFISASRRTEHVKRRHKKGSRFTCVQCDAAFVRSQELRKHVEKAHPSTVASSEMIASEIAT